MNRNINLVNGPGPHQEAPGFENVTADRLDSLYSCSIDTLTCSIFSLFESNIAIGALNVMLDKLKPKGQLVLSIGNLKKVAKLYSSNNLSDQDFFQIIKNIHNNITYNDIINELKNKPNYIISNIKKDNIYVFINITRINI
jgi:hypothetical protein